MNLRNGTRQNVIKQALLKWMTTINHMKKPAKANHRTATAKMNMFQKLILKKNEYIKEHTPKSFKNIRRNGGFDKSETTKMKVGGEDVIDDETHKTVPILTKYEKRVYWEFVYLS